MVVFLCIVIWASMRSVQQVAALQTSAQLLQGVAAQKPEARAVDAVPGKLQTESTYCIQKASPIKQRPSLCLCEVLPAAHASSIPPANASAIHILDATFDAIAFSHAIMEKAAQVLRWQWGTGCLRKVTIQMGGLEACDGDFADVQMWQTDGSICGDDCSFASCEKGFDTFAMIREMSGLKVAQDNQIMAGSCEQVEGHFCLKRQERQGQDADIHGQGDVGSSALCEKDAELGSACEPAVAAGAGVMLMASFAFVDETGDCSMLSQDQDEQIDQHWPHNVAGGEEELMRIGKVSEDHRATDVLGPSPVGEPSAPPSGTDVADSWPGHLAADKEAETLAGVSWLQCGTNVACEKSDGGSKHLVVRSDACDKGEDTEIMHEFDCVSDGAAMGVLDSSSELVRWSWTGFRAEILHFGGTCLSNFEVEVGTPFGQAGVCVQLLGSSVSIGQVGIRAAARCQLLETLTSGPLSHAGSSCSVQGRGSWQSPWDAERQSAWATRPVEQSCKWCCSEPTFALWLGSCVREWAAEIDCSFGAENRCEQSNYGGVVLNGQSRKCYGESADGHESQEAACQWWSHFREKFIEWY